MSEVINDNTVGAVKIQRAVEIMRRSPRITPGDMSTEMGLPIKTVYLLRSQAKKKIRREDRMNSNKPKKSAYTNIGIPREWDDDAKQMAEEVKSGKKCSVPDEKVTMLLNDSTKLLKELMEAKIIIKYLEAKLMGAGS